MSSTAASCHNEGMFCKNLRFRDSSAEHTGTHLVMLGDVTICVILELIIESQDLHVRQQPHDGVQVLKGDVCVPFMIKDDLVSPAKHLATVRPLVKYT